MRLPRTLNVQIGRKLADKSKEDVMKEVIGVFKTHGVVAVQLMYDTIRVTLRTTQGFEAAKRLDGVRLFGLWCPILGGGPPLTIVHVFDYPFEESDALVTDAFNDFGNVKRVKDQLSITDPEVFTGTRLVSMVLKANPPRSLLIGGYLCRVWYKGQPLVCNLCGIQGHKSANCPNKDKCRLCGETGHFARQCRNAWGRSSRAAEPPAAAGVEPPVVPRSSGPETVPETVSGANDPPPPASGDVEDDDFHDASDEGADISQFTSSEDLLSQDILSFSDSQSILRNVVPRSTVQAEVGDDIVRGSGNVPPLVAGSSLESPPSQSSAHSGPSEAPMDASVSVGRKRKGRSPLELNRAHSADDLASNRKVFKAPAPRVGHHSRLPASVNARPSAFPVRVSALPARSGARPSGT